MSWFPMKALADFQTYPCGSEFITIKDISHNEFWSNEEALECIDNYLEEIQ